jgi:hypothetical protein
VDFGALELLWQFFSSHGSTELVLSLSKRHGIPLKDLKKKALVGFGALELWWLFFFLPRKHGNTEYNKKIST